MRIGIFPAIAGRRGAGVETYEIGLVRSVVPLGRDHEWRVFCLSDQAAAALAVDLPNVKYHVLWPRIRSLSIPISLPLVIRRSGVDLVHATYIPPLHCRVPLVVTVQDVCVHTHPDLFPKSVRWRLNQLLYNRLSSITQIICAAEATRNSLVRDFRVPEDRVTVIPFAVESQFRRIEGDQLRQILEAYNITHPYLLFAGNLRVGNKNLLRLLEAFQLFRQRCGSQVRLVLTGRRSWQSTALDETIDRLGLRTAIIETGWIPPEHVPALYSGAEMLVFPTLCEGFGLPALEAMACGTPVLTSNASCMPEVTGGAALLVDPLSVPDIANGMVQLFTDRSLRESLLLRAAEWQKRFSWERTARETIEVYRRALSL